VPPAPALPTTDKQVLFSTDFSTPDLSAWMPFGDYSPPDGLPASWTAQNGVLAQSGIADEEGASPTALLLTNDSSFGDSTLDAYFYSGGGEAAGVVMRYGPDGYYMLKVYATAPNSVPKAVLLKATSSDVETTLASSSDWPGYAPKSWYRLTLTAAGSTLTAMIDGKQVASASDTQFSKGRLGLYAFADGTAKFDNVRVTAP
jgi:hypothetical protein